MFSTDDALMDLTQSQTINLASGGELLEDENLQNYDSLLPGGARGMILDDGSAHASRSHTNKWGGSTLLSTDSNMNLNVKSTTTSAAIPCSDLGFENFLANLAKLNDSSTKAGITRNTPSTTPFVGSMDQSKTQRPDIDKENQVPKSLNGAKQIGDSFHRRVFCPEGNISMDMTKAHTGHILGVDDDDDSDDPFQCLFPTQDMYTQSDKRISQMTGMTEQQHSAKIQGMKCLTLQFLNYDTSN